jgi:hypothetical protein
MAGELAPWRPFRELERMRRRKKRKITISSKEAMGPSHGRFVFRRKSKAIRSLPHTKMGF